MVEVMLLVLVFEESSTELSSRLQDETEMRSVKAKLKRRAAFFMIVGLRVVIAVC
jgi:hypothetical protein